MTALHDLSTWWHPAYIEAARSAYPAVTKGHELAVGWKLTSVTGRTHGDHPGSGNRCPACDALDLHDREVEAR